MFPLFCPGETLDSWKPWWLMTVAKSLRALENKRQGAWTEERCWAFPLARLNIHSPAGRSQGAGWGGEARLLCSPCCCVQTADSAEDGHVAFSVVSWIWKREDLFFFLSFTFLGTVHSWFYQHGSQVGDWRRLCHSVLESAYGQRWSHTVLVNTFKELGWGFLQKSNWTAEREGEKKRRQDKSSWHLA